MTHKRKPKTLESLYRAQLAFRKDVETQLALIRLDMQSDRIRKETVTMLIEHTRRLVREKETLMLAIGDEDLRKRIAQANRFMADPITELEELMPTLTDVVMP